MAKKAAEAKNGKNAYRKDDLWISPSFSLKRRTRHSDWEIVRIRTTESNRFLELADIALSLELPQKKKRTG